MICAKCGTELHEQALRCWNCGAETPNSTPELKAHYEEDRLRSEQLWRNPEPILTSGQKPFEASPQDYQTGIRILALLALIFGALGILSWLSMLTGGAFLAAGNAAPVGGLFIWWLVRIVISVLQLAFCYGAWTLRPWAWILGTVLQVVSLALALLYIISGSSFAAQMITIVIDIVILAFLFRPDVRQAFRKAANNP